MSPKFVWSAAVGPEGARAVAIERTPGRFYVGHYERGRSGLVLKALPAVHTRDGATAAALAWSRTLLLAAPLESGAALTVGVLLARYTADVSAHKKGQQPAEDARRAALWLAFLGADTDVMAVTKTTLKRFERARRAGTIAVTVWRTVKGERQLVPLALKANPSESTVGADVIYLQAVYNWALAEDLIPRNRLARYKDRPKTAAPRRPVATYDRYLQVRAHAGAHHDRFPAFLDIIEGMGWRVSAVCQLTAAQVDRTASPLHPFGRIYKNPKTDKEGAGGWVPMPESVRRAVDAVPAVGGAWLFPAPRDPRRPWGRSYARDCLEAAERAAGLAPIEGGDFHPYRRAWATARKHLPTPDVMATGGWRDRRSLETAYQQVDPETMRRVALENTKLRDADQAGGAGDN